MDPSALLRSLAFPVLLAGGLLVPGWLLGRALRTPAGWTGSFLGSAVILFQVVLGLDAVGLPLTLPLLAISLGLVAAGLELVARRSGRAPAAAVGPSPPRLRFPEDWPALLPALGGLAAITLRAVSDPLSGFDTVFRWDFLARQMLTQGSLGFYPPVTDGDFALYGWCDGIAPLVSTLYLWAYHGFGRPEPLATAPVVVGPALLLFGAVAQLATRAGGRAAGGWAVSLLAGSAVLLWGVALGQETGLTALALVAMFGFLARQAGEPTAAWVVWAGIAAGVGALAREYGIAFAALGSLALAWQRADRRAHLRFLLAFAAVALPWYARVWLKTGHPLFNHDLAGWFPTNSVHRDYLHAVAELHGLSLDATVAAPWVTGALLTLAPLGLGFAGGVAGFRRHGAWLGGLVAVIGLWLASIHQTSGGFVYALRVLTPALALGAILGGVLLARVSQPRMRFLLRLVLLTVALDAAVRSLHLPVNAAVAWWREPAGSWREFGRYARQWGGLPVWRAVAEAAGDHPVVATDPVVHAHLTRHGARVLPLFSPAVRRVIENSGDRAATLAGLHRLRVRFIVTTRHNPVADRWLQRYPLFGALASLPTAATGRLYSVHDLRAENFVAAVRDLPSAPPRP